MEQISVNLIPDGRPPVCHVSQNDVGRTFRVNLYNGFAAFTFAGTETASVAIRKPDGTVVTATLTYTPGDSFVDITTTDQMTACAGDCLCDIKIEDNGAEIGTLNFIMQTEPDPLAGGIQSASDIATLKTQIIDLITNNADVQAAIQELFNS